VFSAVGTGAKPDPPGTDVFEVCTCGAGPGLYAVDPDGAIDAPPGCDAV
jgi:hypothetical protein